jgi:protein-S-isoprenylcysteine O-methyltransferase Ste14
MEKLSFYGIGPKIGRITLPYLAVTIALTIIFHDVFTFGKALEKPLLIAGIILIVVALVFYFTTIVGCLVFRKYIHEEEELLERIFGEEFLNYSKKTSRIFPIPF